MVPNRSSQDVPRSGARVGADLQAARLRLGIELGDIAARLRIRIAHLEAIEEGRIRDLPGITYAVGFMRVYAGLLGLDPDEVTRRFRAEAAEANQKPQLEFPAPVSDRGVPAGALLLVGLAMAVAAYIGWYRYSGENATVTETVPNVPDRLATLAVPSALTSGRNTTAPENAAPPPVPPTQAAAALPTPNPTGASAPAASNPGSPPGEGSAPGANGATQGVADDARIVLRATSDAWMQVREIRGQVLLNRVLRAGETWSVPARPNLVLTTGNAGGTEIDVDGAPAVSLGASGLVRRDVPLDPEAIKSGKLTAAAPTKPRGP
jgi:cytoskeleton protein RodZ